MQIDFTTPDRPDCEFVDTVHGRHNGYIPFARRNESGGFEEVVAIPANSLPGLFNETLQELMESDGYFGINGMWHQPSRPNRYGLLDLEGEPLKLPSRKGARNCNHLTSCFVDLDLHRAGISVGQAIGAVIDAQDRGDIPPPSIITRSGRGIWLLWLLRDSLGAVQKAWPEKLDWWSRIQIAITDHFEYLAADAAARDCARYMRISGSQNSNAPSRPRVGHWVQYDAAGNFPVYTLQQLSDSFGVVARPRRTLSIPSDVRTSRARKGQWKRWEWDYKRFWALMDMRPTIPIGTRHNHLYVIGVIIGRMFQRQEERDREIEITAGKLVPKMQQENRDRVTIGDAVSQLRAAASSTQTTNQIRHKTIAEYLQVTAIESERLSAELGKEGWPACQRESRNLATVGEMNRDQEQRVRRDHLRRFIQQASSSSQAPTVREFQAALLEIGVSASLGTINTDLKAIGYRTGRERVQRSSGPPNHSLFDDPPG